MIRSLTKDGIAFGSHLTGIDKLIGAARGGTWNTPLVVVYHRVVDDFEKSAQHTMPSMLVSKRTFERQLNWIGRHYEFTTLDKVSSSARKASKPLAAVTFDDGYRDVYENAFPILQRKGIPATVFVVSDLVGTSRLYLHDALFFALENLRSTDSQTQMGNSIAKLDIPDHVKAALMGRFDDPYRLTRFCLKRLRRVQLESIIDTLSGRDMLREAHCQSFYSMDWNMLRKMSHHDIVTGSHSKTHALLTNEPAEVIMDEVRGSRITIERELGLPVRHFAYPDGKFNATVVDAVAAAGYESAFTTCQHRNSSYPELTIPRRGLWEKSGYSSFERFSTPLLSCQLNGVFDIAGCRQAHDA